MKSIIHWLFGRTVKLGCVVDGDKTKDPNYCWNVRCQLGKVCCRRKEAA